MKLALKVTITFAALMLFALPSFAWIPQEFNYQGILLDDMGSPLDGDYTIRFRIYPDDTTTTSLWVEYHPTVTVDDGLFNVILGSINPIPEDIFLWYYPSGMWLGVEPAPGPEIDPRVKLTSVPWAFRAGVADTVLNERPLEAHNHDDLYFRESELQTPGTINNAGNPVDWTKLKNVPAGFADGVDDEGSGGAGDGHSLDADDGSPVDALYVNHDGYVGIGTTSPDQRLDLEYNWNSHVALEITNTNLGSSSSERIIFRDENGADAQIAMYDHDNTIYPAAMLFWNARPNSNFRWDMAGGEKMRLSNAGFLGIGTSNPAQKLHVNGTIQATGFKMPIGMVAGEVLTTDASGNGTWQAPAAVSDGDWVVNGSEMYSNVSGDVGIGTTNPLADFHVRGPSTVGEILITPNVSSAGDARLNLTQDWNGNYGGFIKYDGANGDIVIGRKNAGSDIPRIKIDGLTPYVEMYGQDRQAVFNMNSYAGSSVILPSDAINRLEISDEPGVADYEEGSYGVTLDGTYQTLASHSISSPTSGYVLVIATCQARAIHSNGTTSSAEFGVSTTAGSYEDNQDVLCQIGSAAAGATYDHVITVHGLFDVGTGSDTFYLIGHETGGNWNAFDFQLSLIYFPTAYGTVETGPSKTAGVPDEAAPMVTAIMAGDAATLEAESEAFNAARIERELAEIRAELEEIRSQH